MKTQNCTLAQVKVNAAQKLASKREPSHSSIINVKGVEIGGKTLTIIAGPCAVESEDQLLETASLVSRYGAQILRGGAFKPRSSPYSFQGLEEEGLKLLQLARLKTGMPVVTEVMDILNERGGASIFQRF